MDCWNETCMISNLPILGGEECAIAILLNRGVPEEGISPTDRYMPLAIIHGVYDNYGRLENINKEEASALLFALPALNLQKREDGDNVSYTVSTVKDFLDEIQAGEGLFIQFNKKGRMLPLRYVFLKTRMIALATPDKGRQSIIDKAFLGDIHDVMRGIREVLPYYPVSNQLIYPFHKALVGIDRKMAYKNISQIVSLYRLLSILRKSWYIPSGKGSQCDIVMEMYAYCTAYTEEIRSLEKQLSN